MGMSPLPWGHDLGGSRGSRGERPGTGRHRQGRQGQGLQDGLWAPRGSSGEGSAGKGAGPELPKRCTPAASRPRGAGDPPPGGPQGCISGTGLGAPHCWRRTHCPSTPSSPQLFTRRPSQSWDRLQAHELLGLQAPVQGGPAFQHLLEPSRTFQHLPALPCEKSSCGADCTAPLAPGGRLPVPTMPLASWRPGSLGGGKGALRPPSHAVLSRPWGTLSPRDPPLSGDPRSCVLSTRLHRAKEQRWEEEGNLFVNFALCYGKLLGFKKIVKV